MLDTDDASTPAQNHGAALLEQTPHRSTIEYFLLNSRPLISSLGFLYMVPFVFAPSSLQIAGALSAVVILFITLWIGTLFQDLPKVLLWGQKKTNFLSYLPGSLFGYRHLVTMQLGL